MIIVRTKRVKDFATPTFNEPHTPRSPSLLQINTFGQRLVYVTKPSDEKGSSFMDKTNVQKYYNVGINNNSIQQ